MREAIQTVSTDGDGRIETAQDIVRRLDQLQNQLVRMQCLLESLAARQPAREWYNTAELAVELDKAEFTTREWCRTGRIRAEKRLSGRGKSREWVISHAELLRIRSQGLLPAHRVSPFALAK